MTHPSFALAPAQALIQYYSEQVLQWQLGQDAPLPTEDATRSEQAAARVLANAARAGHSHVIVLGLGDGTLACHLRQALPADCMLLIVEDQPSVARAILAHTPDLRPHVLVDSSPWALFLLCQALGLPREQCSLCYNPAYARKCATGLPILEQWRRLFLGAQALALPALAACASTMPTCMTSDTPQEGRTGGGAVPRLSVACIAHPEEALLREFFSHIPPWVHEVVVVWDGCAPAYVPPCAVPVRQTVRALNGDFAAQRNTMLECCTGEWCLYLDVDERLDAATWAAIPAWLSLPTTGPHAVGGIALPRLTFMGDAGHVRMGYGLWPDVQMRLFPLPYGQKGQEDLRFVGAVHEQLTGLQGASILVGGHGIWHYSHIRKDAEALRARLQVFNAAAAAGDLGTFARTAGAGPAGPAGPTEAEGPAGAKRAESPKGPAGPTPPDTGTAQAFVPHHVLSAAYPRLPLAYFTRLHASLQGDLSLCAQEGDAVETQTRKQGQGAWLLPL